MFGWIPIVGPLIDGIVSIFNKFQDKQIVAIQTQGSVDIESYKDSANIIEATKDDIGIRLARDIIIFPWSLWAGGIGWDTFIAKIDPNLMLHIPEAPKSVPYLPYAVVVFLLGNIGINAWRRK